MKTMNQRKTILYIAMSLDGYIAQPGDDLSFLSKVEMPGEDYGYASFIKTVDTVILGKRTYDWVMKQVPEFVHADKKTYVYTRSAQADEGNTSFYSGSLKSLIASIKLEAGKYIFIDGGAVVVNTLLQDDLIDEFIISIIPTMVGDGIRLFADGRPEQDLQLVNTTAYKSGLVQLHYKRTNRA